jgi:hypothetical protein
MSYLLYLPSSELSMLSGGSPEVTRSMELAELLYTYKKSESQTVPDLAKALHLLNAWEALYLFNCISCYRLDLTISKKAND